MDKRIIKTRKNLKKALLKILEKKPFDKITVTEICDYADTSRITFYTHYNDKYDLLKDLFRNGEDLIRDYYYELQEKNNPEIDPLKSCQNLLTAFIRIFFQSYDFFHSSPIESNLDLVFLYYRFITDNITLFLEKHSDKLKTNFPKEELSAFLALGFFGYMHQANALEKSPEEFREKTQQLAKALVESDIFQLS